ncbi:MAG: indolepyruvate ferredoxin oxidoreductase subunit alpha, partial [Promethearchaeota archaeon]
GRTIVKAGALPFPITETLIEFLQTIINEDQARFLLIFKKHSLTYEQIKQASDLSHEEIKKMLEELMDNGIVVGSKSRSSNIMVYRLMGPYPGILEYSLMRGEKSDKNVKIAKLIEKIFLELSEKSQKNFDSISKLYKQVPAVDRTLPVEKEVEVGTETVIPYEELEKYFEKYGSEENNIGLANCYCRHEQELLNNSCKINAPKLNCIILAKSAQFAIKHGFAKSISKERALEVCREAENHGLVHKAFHVHSDPKRDLEAVCNCCKCCCGIFQLYHRGVTPYHTVSSYIAEVFEDCIGCGTCIEKCPIEALNIVDEHAVVDEAKCIGCGVCTQLCPENAIHLKRTGLRDVFLPLKRIKVT